MRLAGRNMLAGRPDEVIAPADRSIELGKRLGVEHRVLFAWQARGAAMSDLGDPSGVDVLRDALQRALELGELRPTVVGYNNFSFHQWLMEGARAGLETKLEGIAYASRRGRTAKWLEMEAMWINFDLGEWDEVLAVAAELLSWHEATGGSEVPAIAPVYQSLVLTFRGRSAEVADAPAAFLPVARDVHDTQVLVPALAAGAAVAYARGDAAAAIGLVEELEETTRVTPAWSRLLHALPVLRICIDLRRLDLGERFFDAEPSGARQQAVSTAGRAAMTEARGERAAAATLVRNSCTSSGGGIRPRHWLPFLAKI